MTRALEGIRIVEVGRFVTGPEAGVLLADLGADVIKVESPKGGDPFRQWGKGGYAPNFTSLNRNKKSLALDFTTEAGLEIFFKLIDEADVVIENFRVGQTERWGWGYDTVIERNPRIVYCSISGFGRSGPYQMRPGFDTVGQAMSGLLSVLTDLSDPRPMGISFSDHLTGIYACYGIMGALLARERTGKGQRVDTSLLQATVAFMSENIANYFATGVAGDQAHRARGAGIWTFLGGDGKPFVIHLSSPDKFWQSLAETLGHQEWATDPRFVDRAARNTNYDELRRVLQEIFVDQAREYWLERLIDADIPCAPINTIAEVFEDPQVEVLQMKRKVVHPLMGQITLASPGVSLSETPLEWDLAPPVLGEHTAEILQSIGYGAAEIASLADDGVVRISDK